MPAHAYRFSPTARAECPADDLTRLLDAAFGNDPLTPEGQYRVTRALYGLFGEGGPVYRTLGWAWDMRGAKQMQRFLVACDGEPDDFRAYWAPTADVLRVVLRERGLDVVEIVAAPSAGC